MRFPNTLAPSDPALGAAAPAARLLPVELTFGRLACKLDDGDAPRGPAFLFTVQREATLINRALGTDYEVSRSPRHYEIEPRRSISTKRAGVRRWLRPGPMILRERTRRDQSDQGELH